MANSGLPISTGLFVGMGLGAGLMYYFDPRRGNRRRELLRGQVASVLNQLATDNRGEDAGTDQQPATPLDAAGAWILRRRWPPVARVLAGSVGTGLMLKCLRSPTLANLTLGTLGLGLLARALVDKDFGRLLDCADLSPLLGQPEREPQDS